MRIPGPKWGAGRPPLETPKSSLARQTWPNSSPLARLELRCRWGRPRARARSPRPPHLHRFVWGLTPPCPLRSPKGKVRRSCAPAHGTAFVLALRQRLRKSPGSSCREAARSSVTSLARLWPKATLARPPGGIPKGAQPSLASLCLLSAGQKVGARRGLSASKGKIRNLRKGKRDQ